MTEVIPADPTAQSDLVLRWSRTVDFSAIDRPDESGAWNLVYSLRSIEESCRVLLEKHLPGLMSASEEHEIRQALREVELELRHLVYHARDARYFEVDIFELEGDDHTAGRRVP